MSSIDAILYGEPLKDIANLRASDLTDRVIARLAWNLTGIQRWNGCLSVPWSVADHSVALCSAFQAANAEFTREEVLWCLLHDMPEAIIGDIPAPLIDAGLADDLSELGARIMMAICDRFSISHEIPSRVAEMDVLIRDAEIEVLGGQIPYWMSEPVTRRAVAHVHLFSGHNREYRHRGYLSFLAGHAGINRDTFFAISPSSTEIDARAYRVTLGEN